ncbi:hypothetical protein NDU88_007989 [Pleurodeles waltl]|uniref:Uncharacterized protein n=1 Tax=Pleurodeles waltl TaxID=8319 RepID=A0AAV7QMC8_PLEWA|nr:hypothetical protein NDU88_007989 [Pleurodeles waltl]
MGEDPSGTTCASRQLHSAVQLLFMRRPQRGKTSAPRAYKPSDSSPAPVQAKVLTPQGAPSTRCRLLLSLGAADCLPPPPSVPRGPPDHRPSPRGPGLPARAPTTGAPRPAHPVQQGRSMVSGSGFRAAWRSSRRQGQPPKRARCRSPRGQRALAPHPGNRSGAPSIQSLPQGVLLRHASGQAVCALFVRCFSFISIPGGGALLRP